jgi:deoxyribose-phosphate aldolase
MTATLSPQDLIQFIDLTNLNDGCSEKDITDLCQKAVTPHGPVAAVCIYPQFVQLAKQTLATIPGAQGIQICTVVNFPVPNFDSEAAAALTRQAVHDGADEIDVVFPYQQLTTFPGTTKANASFLLGCVRSASAGNTMKVILETAAFKNHVVESGHPVKDHPIYVASMLAIRAGADFIKTSTGKHPDGGATIPAAEIMLAAASDARNAKPSRVVGFKAAGGVSTVEDAMKFVELASKVMGPDYVKPATFRLGTSRLLTAILEGRSGSAGY